MNSPLLDLFSSSRETPDPHREQMSVAGVPLFEVTHTPPDDVLERLTTIMRELAIERGSEGVTVARVIHVAKARGVECGPEGTGTRSRAGSWRAVLGKRAGLVSSGRMERVDATWFPGSHSNPQTVWLLPQYARRSA